MPRASIPRASMTHASMPHASMTHASIPKEKREELGIKDGLIRLSIGLETIDDILSDLKNALS